jgi:predicted nucleic acid-binding Zn finger protein
MSPEIFDQLRMEKKFTADLIKNFEKQYGKMFFKALEKIKEKNVFKNVFSPSKLTIWTVIGKNGPYLVYPELYCQCKSFILDTIYRKKSYYPCKHLLAQKIAETVNQFKTEKFSDDNWKIFLTNH